MIEVFARVIVSIAIFLEFTSDEFLNEDISIDMVEQLALDLQNLTSEEKKLLVLALKKICSNCTDKEMNDFSARLPESFGLIDA